MSLHSLFAPASVAVVGASDDPGSVGGAVLRNLVAAEFPGPIHPVNPRHATVGIPVTPAGVHFVAASVPPEGRGAGEGAR